jgi:hypothetical protein
VCREAKAKQSQRDGETGINMENLRKTRLTRKEYLGNGWLFISWSSSFKQLKGSILLQ